MTAASPHRKRRGAETQRTVAAYLAEHGWPHATDAGAGRPGQDVLGVAGLAIEIKGRRDLRPLEWVRQAAKTPGLPLCVFRPDGIGPAAIADWPVLLRLADIVELLHAAGYGDPT
jgi:hypothetical protein